MPDTSDCVPIATVDGIPMHVYDVCTKYKTYSQRSVIGNIYFKLVSVMRWTLREHGYPKRK
jgi:hypothetical protein